MWTNWIDRIVLPERYHSSDGLVDVSRELVDMVQLFLYWIHSPIQPCISLLKLKPKHLNKRFQSSFWKRKKKRILFTYSLATMFGWTCACRIALVPIHIFYRLLLVQWPRTWTARPEEWSACWIPFGLDSDGCPKKTTLSEMDRVVVMRMTLVLYTHVNV